MNPSSRITRFGNAFRLLLIGACLSVAASAQVLINAGGAASGAFGADASFAGGTAAKTADAITTAGVANAAPQAVYQTERWGACTYTIPGLINGATYTARLHFAEIYFNAAKQRQFNVSINGAQVLNNFDIFAAAGAADKAIVKEFTTTATGGQVVIAFTAGAANNPKISGIEILSNTIPPPATSINSGGGASGNFVADAYYQGGTAAVYNMAIDTSAAVNPAPQSVYQSERWGVFTYTFNGLQAGSVYTARLHFAEIYFEAAGQRKFNVSINGAQVLNNFDVFAEAGAANKAIVKEFPVTVSTNGQVIMAFSAGIANNPKISGIELVKGIVNYLTVTPTSLSFLPIDTTKSATVSSNTVWNAVSDQAWLTVSSNVASGNGTLALKPANNVGPARNAVVTVTGGGITRQILVTQASGETVSVNPVTLSFVLGGGTSSVAIASNANWHASSNQAWLTVTPVTGNGDGALTVTASSNPTAASRSAMITVQTGTLSRTITVSQAGMEQVLSPVFSPAGGTFTNEQMVTITCPISGSTIRYTVDGSNPNAGSTVYTGPIRLLATTTIKAYATANGLTDSALVSAIFTKKTGGLDWSRPETVTARWMAHYMGRGTNLGNTYEMNQNAKDFDSVKKVIDAFIAAGFTNVRIPTNYGGYGRSDGAGNVDFNNGDLKNLKRAVEYVANTVNPARMAQGKDPIIVIVNTHHETWAMNDLLGSGNYTNNMNRLTTIWRGICTMFKDLPDTVIFEFFNEPHDGMNTAQTTVADMTKKIYSTIRNYTVDGVQPHKYRKLLFGGCNWNSTWGLTSTFSSKAALPGEGNDRYIIATYHFYNAHDSAPGSLDGVKNWGATYDIPIHMGEFGVDHRGNISETNKTYYRDLGNWAVQRGFCFSVWDDNGWFQIYNRGNGSWNAFLGETLGNRSVPPAPTN